MKIPNELRAVIKSAFNANEKKVGLEQQSEWQSNRVRAQAFASKNPLAKKAAALRKRGLALTNEARDIYATMGLDSDATCIRDEDKFRKAGGQTPQDLNAKRWNYDATIARLAGMTEKAGFAHLKTLGIDWS